MKLAALTFATLLLLSAAGTTQAEMTQSTVALEGIKNVHLLGGFQLTVKQGNEEYVTITADEEVLDKVEARIKGDTLALATKRDFLGGWGDGVKDEEVSFEVQVRDLRYLANRGSGHVTLFPMRSRETLRLNIHGSGEIVAQDLFVDELELKVMGSGSARIQRLETQDLEISVHGSGDVEVAELRGDEDVEVELAGHGSGDIRLGEGQVEELKVRLHGSGDVDAGQLQARQVSVSIQGSGDVEVHPTRELDVSISGSGDVVYRGQPTDIDKSLRGSGDVRAHR